MSLTYSLAGRYWGVGKPVGIIFVYDVERDRTTASLVVTLPRMLPGFVRSYQIQSLRTREGRRGSDLHLFVPVWPPGRWHTSRTMRGRPR